MGGTAAVPLVKSTACRCEGAMRGDIICCDVRNGRKSTCNLMVLIGIGLGLRVALKGPLTGEGGLAGVIWSRPLPVMQVKLLQEQLVL